MVDTGQLTAERRSKHGSWIAGSQFTQDVMDQITSSFGWRQLEPFQREGIHMIVHKLQRIMVGDHDYDDHWADIAGYARCIRDYTHMVRQRTDAASPLAYNANEAAVKEIMERQPNWPSMSTVQQMACKVIRTSILDTVMGRSTSTVPWQNVESAASKVVESLRESS